MTEGRRPRPRVLPPCHQCGGTIWDEDADGDLVCIMCGSVDARWEPRRPTRDTSKLAVLVVDDEDYLVDAEIDEGMEYVDEERACDLLGGNRIQTVRMLRKRARNGTMPGAFMRARVLQVPLVWLDDELVRRREKAG